MKFLKNYLCLFISFIILFSSFSVLAENITVDFNKININVNGKKVEGNNILYNDRTYVPLRAISEMFLKEVLWNGETNTVDINSFEGFYFKGNSIGKMGDLNIYSDEYKLFEQITSVTLKIENKDEEISEEKLKEETLNNIKKYKASLILLKENNLSLPENFLDDFEYSFNMTNEYYKNQGLGENGFLKLLEMMGYTYDSYKFHNQIDLIYSILSSHFSKTYSDEELKKFYDENISLYKKDMVQAKHILLTTEGKTDDQIKETEKNINNILERIKKGEDFDTLMNEYCEDPGIKSNPDGYIFGAGEMVKKFEEAAFSLQKKGDVSDVVKTSYGFHIIKLIDRFDTIPFDKAKSTLNDDINNNYIDGLIKEKIDSTPLSIDLSLIKDYISTSEDEIFESEKREIDAVLNNVKISVEGKNVEEDNILYMGRTYVPLRYISEILAKEVIWNPDTNTADIYDKYGVSFSSEEEELDTYIHIIRKDNKEKDEDFIINEAKKQMEYDRKLIKFAHSLNIITDKNFEKSYTNYLSNIKFQFLKNFNSDEEFKKVLDSFGYTEKSLKRIYEIEFYTDKLYEKFIEEIKPSKEEILSYFENNKEDFIYDGLRVKHILLYTTDESGNPLDEETIKTKENVINFIYERAKKGEDFDALIKEYTEDETVEDYPDGYEFTKGTMDEDFEKAAYSIENVGDVCKPFLSKYGYHIIKLEEKIPYLSVDNKAVYSHIEKIIAKEKLKEKVNNS